jgi:peptidoglycan L-alanyl-D-glutamate endopeptidase CwlK
MILHHQERLLPLYPRFAALILKLADNMYRDFEEELIVLQGLRTYEQQNIIWEQGRGTPGKIVTNAKGGYSWHNFGVAADLAPLNRDQSIDWNSSHPQWKRMEDAGTAIGLTSGAHWRRIVDAPHFQITGSFPEAAPTDEARAIVYQGDMTVKDHGLQAFWLAVEKSYTLTDETGKRL